MRRSNGVFTQGERRLAVMAAIIVVAVTVIGLAMGGLINPSLGQHGAGFADLPGVLDATPLR